MHVKTAARQIAIGFGHEGCGKAVFAGDAAHQPFEQHRVICRAQRIVDMAHVDLELARPVFRDRRIRRDALQFAGVIDLVQELIEVLQLVQRQCAVGIQPLAGHRRAGRLRVILGRVYKVELQLGRNHGGETTCLELGRHFGQRPARIAGEGGAVFLTHPEHRKRGRARGPCDGHQGAAREITKAIGIPGLKHQFAVFDIFAPNIHANDGQGHAQPAFDNLGDLIGWHPLAAHGAVKVADTGKDGFDFGMLRQPRFGFALRHGVPFDIEPENVIPFR